MIDLNFIARFKTKAKYKKTYSDAKLSYLNRIRWAVSMFYFGMGLCFATWASRIPDIKTELHLGSGELGTILFAIPLGQLIMMPFSGKLVTRFGSHRILIFSLLFYVLSLSNLGLAATCLATFPWIIIFWNFWKLDQYCRKYTRRLYGRTFQKNNYVFVSRHVEFGRFHRRFSRIRNAGAELTPLIAFYDCWRNRSFVDCF